MSDQKSLSNFILNRESDIEKRVLSGRGLEIYKNNYLFNLLDSLDYKYPIVKKILGNENFKFFAAEFIKSNPSTESNIDLYGQGFGSFLGSREELLSIGYVEDIARLEFFYYHIHSNLENSIVLAYGILDFWNRLAEDISLEGLELDPGREEKISVGTKESFYFLFSA
ncbi:MAG: DNA-binding domain-containing protein [Bdellovibrionales bacterium]